MTLTKRDIEYQWALPEALEVPPDQLQVRLDFYRETVLMHVLEDGVVHTRTVSALDVAGALSREIAIGSGLLPEGALWWRSTREGAEVALWRPPRVWRVALQLEAFKPPRRLSLPMPGLLFACQPGRPPRVYAATRRPRSPEDRLYHAPAFNVFQNGTTCVGTHKYPDDIAEIPESFFASLFTVAANHQGRSRKYPNNLLKLWEELDGKKRYPMKDLAPCWKVGEVMTWQGP